jgi:hypothetical protein
VTTGKLQNRMRQHMVESANLDNLGAKTPKGCKTSSVLTAVSARSFAVFKIYRCNCKSAPMKKRQSKAPFVPKNEIDRELDLEYHMSFVHTTETPAWHACQPLFF